MKTYTYDGKRILEVVTDPGRIRQYLILQDILRKDAAILRALGK